MNPKQVRETLYHRTPNKNPRFVSFVDPMVNADSYVNRRVSPKFAILAAFIFALCGITALMVVLPLYAQNSPVISLTQTTVNAGDLIEISGSGFTPGGYVGSILIDNVIVETFNIPGQTIGGPAGGSFTIPFFIPRDLAAGGHLLEVCSLNPCATGEFEQRAGFQFTVTDTVPTILGTVAYIYDADERAATAYKDLLAVDGYTADPISLNQVLATDFSTYDLIIIGNDSGDPVNRLWGNALEQDQHVASSERPILGLGTGGALFFSTIQPSLGLNNASLAFRTDVYVADPSLPFYQQPNDLTPLINRSPFLTIYNNEVETVLLKPIDQQTPQPIGYEGTAQDFITLAQDDCRQLWGYGGRPEQLTRPGQALFTNAVTNAITRRCVESPLAICQPVLRPESFPAPGLIHFDSLGDKEIPDGTLLTNLFRVPFGVTFPSVPDGQVIASSSAPAPHSQPNVALHQPLDQQIGSDDIPLRILFDEGKSHVGFYFGAEDTLSETAELTAFDADNDPICVIRRTPVPLGHTQFLGIQDAQARIRSLSFSYGGSPIAESIDDLFFSPYTPPPPPRRVLVCRETTAGCRPAPGATVHTIADGVSLNEQIADANGFVAAADILSGNQLWALSDVSGEWANAMPISNTARYSLYFTSEVITVSDTLFGPALGQTNVLTVPVSARNPLMLYHAQIASEWVLESGYKDLLETRIISGSNYLFDFTNGQFALGDVTVSQDLQNWPNYANAPEKADMRLYLNNNLRPEAEAGGVVSALISDTVVSSVAYRPGFMMMGSEWNRFHQPPGDPKIEPLLQEYFPGEPASILAEDWSLALAHELGHYLFFLFDTYLELVEDEGTTTVQEVNSCRYSAMGWFYESENRHFIDDPSDWVNCENTIANQELKRPEWDVIEDWYPWVVPPVTPTLYMTGPVAPPIQLTTVTYLAPPPTSTMGLISTTEFLLNYNDAPTIGASVEARGFLIKNENRVLDLGSPAENSTEVDVTSAQVGDRLCVIDINENVDVAAKQRFHYGCEVVEAGDSELFLEEDPTWKPIIEPVPVGSTSWAITVTGISSTLPLSVTFYPEAQTNAQSFTLMPAGEMTATAVISLKEITPAAYIEVKVANDDDLELNPARRAFVDFGIGGGSMWPGSHWGGHAPIYSPDGTVEFFPITSITLGADQFVAVVRYLNTYPLPANSIGSSVPYGIVAWPPSLVSDGLINFRISQPLLLNPAAQVAGASASLADAEAGNDETEIVIHHWNGTAWEPLETKMSDKVDDERLISDGDRLVSASSRGTGIYVAIELPKNVTQPKPTSTTLYLPVIQ